MRRDFFLVDTFAAKKKKIGRKTLQKNDVMINNAALFVRTVLEVRDVPEGRRGGNKRRQEPLPTLSTC